MGGNWATGYALRPIPAHRKKRTIHLLQNRTFLFTSDTATPIVFNVFLQVFRRRGRRH